MHPEPSSSYLQPLLGLKTTSQPAMAASPSSSPRLPSPPPIAEDQIGPKSPLTAVSDEQAKIDFPENFNQGASRRIRPGTKAADMPEGPPLMELTEARISASSYAGSPANLCKIDSPFQLTEHLKALYNAAIHPTNANVSIPIDRQTAIRLSQPPDGVDRALWLYELCRFLCQKVNSIIIALFADNPPCSAQTCNEMRASEWQYLCAVHDPPKPCCAIDYCCHTLDWAANILTSPKQFPSRLALGTEANTAHQQLRQLTNIFRRVYRIFAHAWFQHRDMFWKVEGQTGLYVFFKTVCDVYGLIPEENYTVPPEAEGMESVSRETVIEPRRPSVLHRKVVEQPATGGQAEASPPDVAGNLTTATVHTTKRHRHVPSTDAASITTVIEEAEEEEKQPPQEPAVEDTSTLETPLAPQTPRDIDFPASTEAISVDREAQDPTPMPMEHPTCKEAEETHEPVSVPVPEPRPESVPESVPDTTPEPAMEPAPESAQPADEPPPTVDEVPEEQHSEGESSGGQQTPPESDPEDQLESAAPDVPEKVEEDVEAKAEAAVEPKPEEAPAATEEAKE
jgi:Mob1/phocein family